MGYTKNAIAGFSWQTILKLIIAGLTLVKLSVVARILTPTDFGLFSLTAIALGIAEATTETGVNFTIINAKQSVNYFLNTAWVVAIVRGFVIGSLMLVAALGLSHFFGEERLLLLISLASLVPVIKGFINPAIVAMRKELTFFNESIYHFSRALVETLLAIGITLLTRDITALIFAMMGAAFFEVIISFVFFSLRPRFQYIHSRGKIILDNARWLSITALLGYLNENVDNFLIGKIHSPYGLGLYQNSYALTHKATFEFAKSSIHGTFPIYSKLAHHAQRLQRAAIRSVAGTTGFILLAALPLLLYPQLIVILLGAQWTEAVPLIRWLTLAGILQSISQLTYPFFMAKKAFAFMNWHLLLSVLIMAVGIIAFGQTAGLLGAVWAIVLSRLITLPIVGWGMWRLWEK